MKNLMIWIARQWDKFGPVPVEYGMFTVNKKDKTFYYVYMLRGNIKVRLGPIWTNPQDCLRFMEALNIKQEACYE
jgi:hypothetical protein